MFKRQNSKAKEVEVTEKDPAMQVEEITLEPALNFQPNRVCYINPWTFLTRDIRIFDATAELLPKYSGEITDEFRMLAKTTGQSLDASSAICTIHRENWKQTSLSVRDGSSSNGPLIGHWKHPIWSTGSAELSFTANSDYSSHNFKMSPQKWYRRAEMFVLDSVTYVWQTDSKITERTWSLFRVAGNEKTEVARFRMVKGFGDGGPLLVNDAAINPLLVAWTCCIVLKKRAQRIHERGSAGGGGGGGSG